MYLDEEQAKDIRKEIADAGTSIRQIEKRLAICKNGLGKVLRGEDPISDERLEKVFEAIDFLAKNPDAKAPPTVKANRVAQLAVSIMTDADGPPPMSGGLDTVIWMLERQFERIEQLEARMSERPASAPALPPAVEDLPDNTAWIADAKSVDLQHKFRGFEFLCTRMRRLSPQLFEEAIHRARQVVA